MLQLVAGLFSLRRFLAAICVLISVPALPLSAQQAETIDELRREAAAVFGKLEPVDPARLDEPIVRLGRRLFWDERLSASGTVACGSCHQPQDWGADSRRFSIDARGKSTARHSQTVLNALRQPSLRWTGDRRSGAHQAERSLTGSMGFDAADEVIPKLIEFGYEADFAASFPDDPSPLTPARYAAAIEAYEATLVTPAPFDRFLDGDPASLDPIARQGLRLFLDRGCADCHSGPLLGGTSLERFGLHQDFRELTGSEPGDTGLAMTTKNEADRDKFRVAMLRNVARTAPYFHDGSVESLERAVQVMAATQLDAPLGDDETAAIVRFLETLTGELPSNYAPPSALPNDDADVPPTSDRSGDSDASDRRSDRR